MDVSYLLKRRAEVVARHEVLESVPGSGWHPTDPQARGERDAGMQPVSARPVGIQDDDRFYFVGPCVARVRDALVAYTNTSRAARDEAVAAADAAGTEPPDVSPLLRHAGRVAARVAAGTGDVIELQSRDFNGVVCALSAVGIAVVTTGVIG